MPRIPPAAARGYPTLTTCPQRIFTSTHAHPCAAASRSCRSAYNDLQVQHPEWEKLPANIRPQNLCRGCYGNALEPKPVAFINPAFVLWILLAAVLTGYDVIRKAMEGILYRSAPHRIAPHRIASLVQCGPVRSGLVWFGLVLSGLVWSGLVWSSAVWCGFARDV